MGSRESIRQGSRELGVGSRESAVGSRELGVGSWELGVGSRESGVGSRESGVGSRESGVGVGSRKEYRVRQRLKVGNLIAYLLLVSRVRIRERSILPKVSHSFTIGLTAWPLAILTLTDSRR